MDQYDPYPETEFEVYTSLSYGIHKAPASLRRLYVNV